MPFEKPWRTEYIQVSEGNLANMRKSSKKVVVSHGNSVTTGIWAAVENLVFERERSMEQTDHSLLSNKNVRQNMCVI